MFAFTDAEIFVDTNKLNNCDFIIYGLAHSHTSQIHYNDKCAIEKNSEIHNKISKNKYKLLNLNYFPFTIGIKPSTFTQIFKKQVNTQIRTYQNTQTAYIEYTITYKIFININTLYKNKPACILEYLIKYNYISELHYTELYGYINPFYVNCEAIMNKINEGISALGNKIDNKYAINESYEISKYQHLYGFLELPFTI
jgi:hypothetical protein